MGSSATAELVERLWARDPTLWTGQDEARWVGWLDEPVRMRERSDELAAFAEEAAGFAHVVVLGMGGSSLAPEVLRRAYGSERLRVLDTTHPAAVGRLAADLDPADTLFLVSSKSGTTLETRSHAEFFWEWTGGRSRAFAAVTDPGSELEELARKRGFRRVFGGEPTIGGRYSALSVFGLAPAAAAGIDWEPLLRRALEVRDKCRSEDNPGFRLGVALGEGWRAGRDKVVFAEADGFELWLEQLLAESTGKDGLGLLPVPGGDPDGPDRQEHELLLERPDDLGAEFYRWEFATAVAGAILGVNPFDQPDVQEAKDRTAAVLAGRTGEAAPETRAPEAVEELLAGAEPPEYVAVQAFVDPERAGELAPLAARARETGCAVTVGLGPRYLHSTGQLHKGGPPKGRFVQVLDETGDDLAIPGRDFGFGRLLRAQADGDFAALAERGRPIVRVRLEDL